MQAHFRHLRSKRFPMIWVFFQSNEFWPLPSPFKNLEVHWDSNSQSGSSFESLEVHSLTFSRTLATVDCDSWASLLAHAFVSPCLGREPKVKVTTTTQTCHYRTFRSKWKNWANFCEEFDSLIHMVWEKNL
jgi:hypothetical protein